MILLNFFLSKNSIHGHLLDIMITGLLSCEWEISHKFFTFVCGGGLVSKSCVILGPHEQSSTRLLCPWDSPGKILEGVAISFSRGSSWLRDQTQVSCIAGRFFTDWTSLSRFVKRYIDSICKKYLKNFSCVLIGKNLILRRKTSFLSWINIFFSLKSGRLFSWRLSGKEPTCQCRRGGFSRWVGRSLGEGYGNPG